MRQIARYSKGGCGSAALPAPEQSPADGIACPPAESPGLETKVDLASLHPGGMTQDAEPGIARFLHAGSPELVIGYGGMKGILAYYRAVLHYGTLVE
jgi:hypothetical protein